MKAEKLTECRRRRHAKQRWIVGISSGLPAGIGDAKEIAVRLCEPHQMEGRLPFILMATQNPWKAHGIQADERQRFVDEGD